MILFNLTHNGWAHVHAHACTLACVAAAAPDLRTLAPAGFAGMFDSADPCECDRACGCDATADREWRESRGSPGGTHRLACIHTFALTIPHIYTHMHTLAFERKI